MKKIQVDLEFDMGYEAGIQAIDYLSSINAPQTSSVWAGLSACILTGLFAASPSERSAEQLITFVKKMAKDRLKEKQHSISNKLN